MSECLQFEIDPLKITESVIGGVLMAVDVLVFSPDDYPSDPEHPVCMIAAAHTTGLSSISKVYTKLFVANTASPLEESLIIKSFCGYLDVFNGGTLAVHYGATESMDEGFDLPYLLLRARDNHPEVYIDLKRGLGKFRFHDTCMFARKNLNLSSNDLEHVESYYGLARKPEAGISDVRAGFARYWREGDASVLRFGLTNVYNCIRIAQSQIRRSICCTDVPF